MVKLCRNEVKMNAKVTGVTMKLRMDSDFVLESRDRFWVAGRILFVSMWMSAAPRARGARIPPTAVTLDSCGRFL
jgi:cytidylate kinase